MKNFFPISSSFFHKLRHGERFMFADVFNVRENHLMGYPRFEYAGLNVLIEGTISEPQYIRRDKIPMIVVASSKNDPKELESVTGSFERNLAICGGSEAFGIAYDAITESFDELVEIAEKNA